MGKPLIKEMDILLSVEKEVIGRSSSHRRNFFDISYNVRKIQKNILNADGINISTDDIEKALETLIKRLVSENSDIFTLAGRFYFDEEICFRIKVSSPRRILS